MRSDKDHLSDILEAIQRVEKYKVLGRARFEADELVQTFVIHQILIIGEAARRVSEALQARSPDIEWPLIIGMRNRLIHGYFQIDAVEVWKTVEGDLPKLKDRIEQLVRTA